MSYWKVLLLALLSFSFVYGQNNKIDSLTTLIKNAENDSLLLHYLYQKGELLHKKREIDSVLKIGQQIYDYAKDKEELNSFKTKGIRLLAKAYYKDDKIETGDSIINAYLKTIPQTDAQSFADLYWEMGYARYQRGDNLGSLMFFLEALPYYEQTGNSLRVYHSLRYGYSRIDDKREALRYTNKILAALPDSSVRFRGVTLLNKGYYEIVLKNYLESFKASDSALKVLKSIGETTSYSVALVYGNIAPIYFHYYENDLDSIKIINPRYASINDTNLLRKKVLDSAIYFAQMYDKLVTLNKHNKYDVYLTYAELARIQGRKKDMLKKYLKAYKLLGNHKTLSPDKRDVAFKIYKEYRRLGKAKKALPYFEVYNHLKDSLNASERQRNIGQAEARFEFEQKKKQEELERIKQREIEKANLEKEMRIGLEREKQQFLINVSIAFGLLIVVVFTLFIFRKLKLTNKQKKEIAIQKKILEKNRNQMMESIEIF